MVREINADCPAFMTAKFDPREAAPNDVLGNAETKQFEITVRLPWEATAYDRIQKTIEWCNQHKGQ